MISIPKSYGTEAAILRRVIKPHERNLSATAARALLQLDFEDTDRRRMHELAIKNQDDALSADERADLQAYLHVGMVLDLLHSKATLALKRPAARR
jgi:hypothetical protein